MILCELNVPRVDSEMLFKHYCSKSFLFGGLLGVSAPSFCYSQCVCVCVCVCVCSFVLVVRFFSFHFYNTLCKLFR